PRLDQPDAPDDDTVDASASTIPLVIIGGQGNDFLVGGLADDVIFGDRGVFTLLNGTIAATVPGHGGPGDFTDGVAWPHAELRSTDPSVGGNDVLDGGPGIDVLIGGHGDDRLGTGPVDLQGNFFIGDHGRVSL